ncbi:Centractin [Paramarasmius palmivorus]|uniref:Centractin n=1 Tax=Paramarasmius palmivorus TaxID=297713 RepID=A0AAW0E154_9AGAR
MSAEFDDVLTNQPVVIDNGSGTIKAGFAGQDHPKCFFPSFVGRPKHVRVMAGALEGDVFIGRRAQEFRGLLKIKYPMEHGIVTDWDDMERIWSWIYAEELGTLSEEHPVLLTEAPLNPRSNRDIAAQIFFDTFNVPALYTSVQAVLSLDVTDYLQLLLRKSGNHLHTTAEREIVRTIKEKCCYVALNPSKEEKDSLGRIEEFRLPDGNVVQLGAERYRAPEILFNPEIIGQEYAGVHQVVVDSINRVDLDLRKSLFSNIVLSGGSTLCRGFGDRLLNEVKKLALKDVKIKIYAPPERKYSTWIGGSILAGLNAFKKMWVSAEEYQEDPDIIHKKAGF